MSNSYLQTKQCYAIFTIQYMHETCTFQVCTRIKSTIVQNPRRASLQAIQLSLCMYMLCSSVIGLCSGRSQATVLCKQLYRAH